MRENDESGLQTSESGTAPVSRMRLLIVGAFPPPNTKIFGGVITSCRLLVESSLPQSADLVLVDSTQISNPPPGLFVRALLAFRRTLKYIHTFEASRPDAVLLFSSAGASFLEKGLMAWYARLRRVPAVLFPRDGRLLRAAQSAASRNWLRCVAGGAKAVLCQGTTWRRFAIEVLGFSNESCPIVPNWTATPALLMIGHERVVRSDGQVGLLFVGWIEFEKGVVELFEAFRTLTGQRDVLLNLVGDGHAVPWVREFIASHGLQDKVRLSGWLDATDILKAYRDADVLVLPSWAEGLPNAMIEAMASGLAVVITSVGNVPDVVADRREAMLVPPKDTAALAAALDEIVSDWTLREAIGRAGHELAGREFAVEVAVDRILNTMEIVRGTPRSKRAQAQG